MGGCLPVDIAKGDDVVIFVDDVGRNLATDDLRKNGIHFGSLGQLRKHMCSGLAFNGRIGRHDHLLDLTLAQPCGEQVEAELLRPQAIHRREAAKQHEIMAAIAGCGFNRKLVDRCLDDAEQMLVT